MSKNEKLLDTLLSSVAGVLIFISTAHWLNLNGYDRLAPVLIAIGVLLLFSPQIFLRLSENNNIITKALLFSIGHIFIFIGTKVYFERWIDNYWVVYLGVGVLLLNKHREIARFIFGEDPANN